MPPYELADHGSIVGAETPPLRDAYGHGLADLGVVAVGALADVVQQRRDREQVGAGDIALDLRGLDAGLEAVPVDREAVHGRRRAAQADRDPLGQQQVDDAGEVELVPHPHQPLAGAEQIDHQTRGRRRPRIGQLAHRLGKARRRARAEREALTRRSGGGAQRHLRVGAGVGLAGDDDLAFEDADAFGQRRHGRAGRGDGCAWWSGASAASILCHDSDARCAMRRPS